MVFKFFKTKKEKKKAEAFTSDVKNLLAHCANTGTEVTLTDEATVKPIFLVRSMANIDFMKSNKFCTIDTMIYSVFFVKVASFAFPELDVEKSITFSNEIRENLISIIAPFYSIPSGMAQEMVDNRMNLFQDTCLNSPGTFDEMLGRVAFKLYLLILSDISLGTYYPFTLDTLNPLISQKEVGLYPLHIKQINSFTTELSEFVGDIVARARYVLRKNEP